MGKYLPADTEAVRNIYAHDPYFTATEEAQRFAEFDQWLREIKADAWDEGYTSGHSNAMRRMSDEPNAPTTPNPYRKDQSND